MIKITIYLLLFIILLHVIWYAYVKLRYKFWSLQPVFHYYQWWYWLYPVGILNNDLPEKNRFVNLNQIVTTKFNEIDNIHLQSYISLIKNHFLNYKNLSFNPEDKNIVSYFESNNISPYFSLYFENEKLITKEQNIIYNKKLIGGITSRALNVYIKNKEPFHIYYVDYLCVEKSKRNKSIAPTLIQTHVYNTRRMNNSINTFLFKKDSNLNGIVPLTLYLTNSYNIKEWDLPELTHPSFNVLELNKQTLQLFFEFIDINNQFKCYISCNPENLLRLIETNNIYGYIVRNNNDVIGVYLFRNSTTLFNKEKVVDLFFSLSKKDKNKDNFILGFEKSVLLCYKKGYFTYLSIENTSHNNYIIDILNNKKYKPYKTFPTAYYFYNYINKPFFPNDVAIIH